MDMGMVRHMTKWMLAGALLAAMGCLAAQVPNPKQILNKAGETKTQGAAHAAAVDQVQKGTTSAPKGGTPPPPPQKTAAPAAQPSSKGESAKEMAAHAAAIRTQGGKAAAKQTDVGAGRKDPFISPLRSLAAEATPPQQALPPGNAGLLVGQINLVGVVKTTQGMKAMVTAANGRTYFLKDNEKVYNGAVTKITSDSIVFEEVLLDPLGQTVKREVVKKLPGEK
jgi:hypothetical protein